MPKRVIMTLDVTDDEAEAIFNCLSKHEPIHGVWNRGTAPRAASLFSRVKFRSDDSHALGGNDAL